MYCWSYMVSKLVRILLTLTYKNTDIISITKKTVTRWAPDMIRFVNA